MNTREWAAGEWHDFVEDLTEEDRELVDEFMDDVVNYYGRLNPLDVEHWIDQSKAKLTKYHRENGEQT